jgi:hypothetical protein
MPVSPSRESPPGWLSKEIEQNQTSTLNLLAAVQLMAAVDECLVHPTKAAEDTIMLS